ncbi:MAG TPA: AIM24 family protein [Capsulimonadaceae bacterium]
MAVPILVPTAARDAADVGVTYHIEGELVPVLSIELGHASIYFEHHILLWKDPHVQIGIKPLSGAFKRLLAGMPIIMTEVRGPGRIAFSRDGAGHVFPIHLSPGQSIDVREHQFLAATEPIEYTFTRVKGVANMLLGGTGFFIDTFNARASSGVVWLHGYGNVFEITLGPGEQIDIEPGGWIYKDPSVQMETQFQGLKAGFLASAGQLFWNRFTGPGRVGLQSMSMGAGSGSQSESTSTTTGGIGSIIKLIGG